jgi:hypothetical protein
MQSDHRAAPSQEVVPRLLERVTDADACHKRALPYVPTQKMIRAALLSGWPVKDYDAKHDPTLLHSA